MQYCVVLIIRLRKNSITNMYQRENGIYSDFPKFCG